MRYSGLMSSNIEIKARCHDLARARERAKAVATEWIGVDHQVDTYFRTSEGRLKLRESSLSGGQLVPYVRPDEEGPKRSNYQVIPVADPAGLKALLGQILGVHQIVEKEREIALCDNVRIHLDRVVGLGTFIEFEAVFDAGVDDEAKDVAKVERLIEALEITPDDHVAISYEGLLAAGR